LEAYKNGVNNLTNLTKPAVVRWLVGFVQNFLSKNPEPAKKSQLVLVKQRRNKKVHSRLATWGRYFREAEVVDVYTHCFFCPW